MAYLNNFSSIYFNDSDMSKYSEIIPLSRQNYLNDQFFFDNSKKNTLFWNLYSDKEKKPFINPKLNINFLKKSKEK